MSRADGPIPHARTPDEGALVLAALAAIVGVSVGLPTLAVVWGALSAVRSGPANLSIETPGLNLFPAALLGTTLLWSGGIAVLTTALAWPVAWALRTARRSAWAWLLAPMLAPSYLTYAGWGLLRAPRTWLGDALEQAAQHGHRWAPILAGQVLAVIGLALWAVPLAALVLWSGLRRLDPSVLDSLCLEPAGRIKKARSILAMSGPTIGAALATVILLMLGSAIPLHLAQVPTYAIQIWLALDTTPADQQWKVWILAWPLLLAAATAGWLIGSRLTTADPTAVEGSSQPRRSWPAVLTAALIWGAAVLVPLGLFLRWLADPRSLVRFWQLSGSGAAFSGKVALIVGAIGVFVALAVALGLAADAASPRAGLTRGCVRLLLVAGLVPGVLVGSAVLSAGQLAARASPALAGIGDSAWIVVIAHVARFGFIPALVGCYLARTEGPAQRWLRTLDGADSLRGWARATLPTQAGACLSAGLAAAAMSLHEIEAAVVVTPPGDSLPRQVLGYLHYLRTEEMCAAAAWIVASGLLLASLAAILVDLADRSRTPPEQGPADPQTRVG